MAQRQTGGVSKSNGGEEAKLPPDPPTKRVRYDERAMLTAERDAIAKQRRGGNVDSPWVGLALSGGGIRSATFCLGALQRLAKANILRHVDYMSSVSGGGYTAASLQWWWVRDKQSDGGEKLPYGTKLASSAAEEDERLAFLRWHANYLAPGGGISVWSGLAVVLRTLVISLFIWLPIAVMLMMGIEGIPAFVAGALQTPAQFWHAGWSYLGPPSELSLRCGGNCSLPLFAILALGALAAIAVLFVASSVLLLVISILVPPETTDNKDVRARWAAKIALLSLIGAVVGAYFLSQLQGFTRDFDLSQLDPTSGTVFVVSAALLCFGAIAVGVAILQRLSKLEFGVNYGFRRFFEISATYGFAAVSTLGILASLPFAACAVISSQIDKGVILGVITTMSGLASGFYGHFVQAQRLAPRYAARWLATLAAGAFLYGMILFSYLLAHFLINPDPVVGGKTGQLLQVFFFAVLIFALLFGYLSNLNYLGLHRYYRDRLMEVFLPSTITRAAAAPKYSEAELAALVDFWDPSKFPIGDRPYPLFNTNAILIHDTDSKRAMRGGDSFVLSPLFVGSSATQWMLTREHGERHGALTLASAMAASGAAANANAAYIGSGITRDRLISIVMMLLNVRLGIWVGSPGAEFRVPNYFIPGLAYGVLRAGYRSDSAFVELTDGGHFDNLGVYELVRRRADVIVALDSEEDPSTSMSALASVCQRVLEDFNVLIEIGDKADKIAPEGNMGYPNEARFTARSHFVARINYPAVDASGPKGGTFVYVKSNMLKGLSFPAKGYKAKNPDFPNQPTMDQFFEPAQFEAYRELGFFSIEAFVSALGLDNKDKAALVKEVEKAA